AALAKVARSASPAPKAITKEASMDENKLFHISNQMDRETLSSFERNVPTSVCRSIAADHIGRSTSLPAVPSESSGRANFSEPLPIEAPPGVSICDAMMAQEDRLWRRDLKARLGVKDDDGPKAA